MSWPKETPIKQKVDPVYLWSIGIAGVAAVIAFSVWASGVEQDRKIKQRFADIDDAAAHRSGDRSDDDAAIAANHARQEIPLPSSPAVAASPCAHTKTQGEITSTCRYLVKGQLKSPGSAKFPGLFSSDEHVMTSGCRSIVSSWVESQNSFGAMTRTSYDCTYEGDTGDFKAKLEGS